MENRVEIAFKNLREQVEKLYSLSDDSWEKLKFICQFDSLEKGQYLEQIGEFSDYFYFINKGLVRAFTLTQDGREITKVFFDKNGFPGNIVSKLSNEPNKFSLEVLENIEFFKINFSQYRELIHSDLGLSIYHFKYLEQNWVLSKEKQDISQRSDDAARRYQIFLDDYPHLEGRIQLMHIASFLGITQTQLSRIRKR